MNRRDFLKKSAISGGSALLLGQTIAAAESDLAKPVAASAVSSPEGKGAPRQMTVAGCQMLVTKDIGRNERAIHEAIDQASRAKVDFLVTPEGSLSGYHSGFDRLAVTQAVDRVAQHAREVHVGLVLGTCYKEEEEARRTWDPKFPAKREEFCYDQVRVFTPNGEYLGAYSKILLGSSLQQPGTGEMKSYVAGSLRTFSWNGICFGVLICNDLWATPGSTTIPNPYLPWQLKKMGAEVIFHAVNTGHVARYRSFHESSEALWAWSLSVPVVTVNALTDDTRPVNCRSGVVGADGERLCEAPDLGPQFFAHQLILA
jgi:predicted amidohydrolase